MAGVGPRQEVSFFVGLGAAGLLPWQTFVQAAKDTTYYARKVERDLAAEVEQARVAEN